MSDQTVSSEVALFVTCINDLFFPELGEDSLWLLEQAGCSVYFPRQQSCCGQPMHNSGLRSDAEASARHFLDIFADAPAIVVPSGSCAMMIRHEYPRLLASDRKYSTLALDVAGKSYELSEYLVNVAGVTDYGAVWPARATYHDACHLARGLSIRQEPRTLLRNVSELELVEMEEPDLCCGFGGAFSSSHAEISVAMLRQKLAHIARADVQAVITSDSGCIMQMNGYLERNEQPAIVYHLAQVLRGRAAPGK